MALIDEREQLELLEHDLKFLRDLRDVLLNKIASVDLRQDHGDIRTAVVSEPMLPKSPVWPKLSLIGFCSLMAGMGSGLGLIYILDILDDRFRSPEEMRTASSVRRCWRWSAKWKSCTRWAWKECKRSSRPTIRPAKRSARCAPAWHSPVRRLRGWSFPAPSRATARPRCWPIWPSRSARRASAR